MTFESVKAAVQAVLTNKKGATMVEYALLAGLVAVVAVSALGTLGKNVTDVFSSVAGSV